MVVVEIDSLNLPSLEPYKTMRRTMEHRAKGIFVAEGEKVVRRLIESDLKIVSVLLTKEWLEKYSAILSSREVEQSVFTGKKGVLEEIVGYGLHQGIMAIGRVPEPVDVLDFSDRCSRPKLFVAVDGIANSENMGVIIRNCAAFGTQALISGETSCDPYLRRSVRNSMGTIFKLPVAKTEKLSVMLKKLRDSLSLRVIAADPKCDSLDISCADMTADLCLVFGSEGDGISPEVLAQCEVRVKIPMYHDIDSVNVASSVGVALYEAVRQRKSLR
jgi:tRNA G18 (ribose-2'-O)-methylase SpoU